ncbi:MAG: 50S ribosomal protein L15 [Candidatus Buchananbacteria bacterium RIFCSPHIGHO2_02_FULL_38_8]|uniref:Large ribosomal subunit protein uL15 n=2 Tax=Candidatus Buchananiibacteriota TaxID=1817903 RepID=A0A1G1Y1U9_9BACT|nr:MAG: 50S ribosomal protein L15 [Candidatus Buchananbacteria bacterium RIFCSPHIGHO2_01_FULL_39_8]OGY47532.1 MAG: 50S ribosomal protein L15 [Candidatus Buchananbacteria bacterium RIFCSPHIGHO2_02_FULL_38_8]
MELTLHNLKLAKGSKRKIKRMGRGNASGHGTYSGRGQKGQRARSGGKKGLKRRGLHQLLKNKPKLGGFKSLKSKMAIVNLDQLEKVFTIGEIVDGKKLIAKNLIKSNKTGVKILGQGKLTKKLTVIADAFSDSAKKAIMEVGGKAELRPRRDNN